MGAFCHLPRNSVHKWDEVDCLHKTNVNWLGKLLLTLEYSWEDKQLIRSLRPGLKLHCPSWIQDTTYGWTILSSTLAKTFLGRLRSVIPHDAGACSPVPLLEERNYHPSLPIQRHCLYLPKACCRCQSHNFQCLKKERFNYQGDLTLVMAKLPPHPSMSMGLMCEVFLPLPMCWVEVCSSHLHYAPFEYNTAFSSWVAWQFARSTLAALDCHPTHIVSDPSSGWWHHKRVAL